MKYSILPLWETIKRNQHFVMFQDAKSYTC